MVAGTSCIRRVVSCFLITGFVGVVIWVSAAGASQSEKETNEVMINIGVSSAKPGEPIDIPLTLSGDEQAQIGTVVSKITFPKNVLTFNRAEIGLAGELSKAQVQATATPDNGNSDLTVLEITIAGQSPIRPGILAYLKFRVSTEAEKGTLKLQDSKATTVKGEPFQLAKGGDGLVEVFETGETIPMVGCFFFTH